MCVLNVDVKDAVPKFNGPEIETALSFAPP